MFVILLTENFKFRNRPACSKEPVKRAGKVCQDSQDLKSPGCAHCVGVGNCIENVKSSYNFHFHSSVIHSFQSCGKHFISSKRCCRKITGTYAHHTTLLSMQPYGTVKLAQSIVGITTLVNWDSLRMTAFEKSLNEEIAT